MRIGCENSTTVGVLFLSAFEILLDSSMAETVEENSTLVKVKNLSMIPKDCHRDALKALDILPELSFMTGV